MVSYIYIVSSASTQTLYITVPPYYTYIYCLLCININALHHTYISPHALPIYNVGSSSSPALTMGHLP